jgi:hypothetical protein
MNFNCDNNIAFRDVDVDAVTTWQQAKRTENDVEKNC